MGTKIVLHLNVVAMILCTTSISVVNAQDKTIAKIDSYIEKAKETDDASKKNDYYNKAGQLIMSERLDKSLYTKIADAYLEEGNVTSAARYYMRCEKEDKYEGYKKVGDKLIEQAFDDPRTEARTMRKAISYYSKAKDESAGYEAVGDTYYAKGKDFRMKAAEYYGSGKVSTKIHKIANEFLDDGELDKAADVYMKLNDKEGFKEAGDLYYSVRNYNKAYAAYEKGGVTEGIKKYADKLYADDKKTDGDALYYKIAEIYAAQENKEGLSKLAKEEEERGYFAMAASIYGQAGEQVNANKARAYSYLVSLDFETAKKSFQDLGDLETAEGIANNMKYLEALREVANYFEELKSYQPYVTYMEDTLTKVRTPNKTELADFNAYYMNVANDIVDRCYTISSNVKSIQDPILKKVMISTFKRYGAVRNVLDDNFNKKLQKGQVTAKDVIL